MDSKSKYRTQAVRAARIAAVLHASISLAACGSMDASLLATDATLQSAPTETGSTTKPEVTAAKPSTNPKERLAELERRHNAAPQDATAALAYAQALKLAGQVKTARQVLTTTHAAASTNAEIAGSLGLIELEHGQTQKAQKLLTISASSPNPDWRYLSGLGVAQSIQGKQAEAQKHFNRALLLAPGNKTILNNLAMSYMLDKKVDQAERLLKQAKIGEGTPAEISQNLALATKIRETGPRMTEVQLPETGSSGGNSSAVKSN